MADEPRVVGVFLFDAFAPLDVFGPVQMLGTLRSHFTIELRGPEADAPVSSSSGERVLADRAWDDPSHLNILLVPGGAGTRREVSNERLLGALRTSASSVELVTSVCTGAALLAAAGLLDGYRATSNKLAFEWVRSQGPRVDWVPEARWIEDRNRVTSGGVAAGIDMATHLIERLHGRALAERTATALEYRWQPDGDDDPFAALAGLV